MSNTQINNCFVCLDKYNLKSKRKIECFKCNYHSCKKCYETYIIDKEQYIHCMKCKIQWDNKFISMNFTKKFINTTYKNIKENILLNIEKSLLKETQPYAIVVLQKRKIQKYIKLLTIKNNIIYIYLYNKSFNNKLKTYSNEIQNYVLYNLFITKNIKCVKYFLEYCIIDHNYNKYYNNVLNSFLNIKYINKNNIFKNQITKILNTNNFDKKLRFFQTILVNQYKQLTKLLYNININYINDFDIIIDNIFNYYFKYNDLKQSKSLIFNIKCPNNKCNGYISDGWKCNLCNLYTCHKCLLIQEDENHICNENDIKSAELIKNDSKPCPNCNILIFRDKGCKMMFCTQCNFCFWWHTGEQIKKNMHNPYYFNYLKNNNINIENIDSCGDIDDRELISNFYLYNICFRLRYIEHLILPRFHININELNKNLRIQYLLNEIDINTLKKKIQINDKKNNKYTDITNILNIYIDTIKAILIDYVINLNDNKFIISNKYCIFHRSSNIHLFNSIYCSSCQLINNSIIDRIYKIKIDNLLLLVNNELKLISNYYNMNTTYLITNDHRFI